MVLLGIIILLTPGFIALIINGYDFRIKERPLRFIAYYLAFDFVSLMLAYLAMTVLKGGIIISFSPDVFEGYTIYHSNFVCKFMALLFVISAVIGLLERRYHQRIKKILDVFRGIS